MTGERDLKTLLSQMTPSLHDLEYGFGLVPNRECFPKDWKPFALIEEAEGITIIAPVSDLITHNIDHIPGWARISLKIHSDLSAVGLTAAIATALSKVDISANVIAGYFHDHFFVQWDRRHDAMAVLQNQL
jgi:uncharacterized protein